jgi:drug/metabolite transporter (DMT)-like permease
VLFRTRLGLEVWLGVTLAVVGLAMLSGVHVGSPGGNLLVLASTSAQALQILMVERYAPRYDAIALTLVQMAACFVGFLVIALALGSSKSRAAGRSGARCSSPASSPARSRT